MVPPIEWVEKSSPGRFLCNEGKKWPARSCSDMVTINRWCSTRAGLRRVVMCLGWDSVCWLVRDCSRTKLLTDPPQYLGCTDVILVQIQYVISGEYFRK